MSIDVMVIDGPYKYDSGGERTSEDVAADIKSYYGFVKELGGTVLAGYTMAEQSIISGIDVVGGSKSSITNEQSLYLVADIPDLD